MYHLILETSKFVFMFVEMFSHEACLGFLDSFALCAFDPSWVFCSILRFCFLFFRFLHCVSRNHVIVIYLITCNSILYGIGKFCNKATFHNGTESDRAIVRYIIQDVTSQIKLDHFHLPGCAGVLSDHGKQSTHVPLH